MLITKNRISRIVLLFVSMIISALLYNTLLLPLELVTGGTSGIATITYYLYYIDPAITLLILSLACAVISYMYLGVERTNTTIIAVIMYPLIVKLTSFVSAKIVIDTSDILLIVLFAGVISGVANGLLYKTIAKSSMFMNMVIVLVGSIFFGLTNALYAILFLYINSLVVDKVLLGISNNKAFYILTDKENEVKEYIIDVLKHTVTTFDVKGGFLENKKRVILTVIPSREYYKVTEGIKNIDKDAFFVVTDSYQVEGAK